MRIAFYAPLKSPSHSEPSGDRAMARLLLAALREAGFAPSLASELRTLDMNGDVAAQERTRAESAREAARLIGEYEALEPARRPRLWFTYHVYYKAPDWIGPAVCDALAIPYVVAEGSRAGKRAEGPWALGHRGAEAALDRANAIFVMSRADREALERSRPDGQDLLDLPPFLDLREWPEAARTEAADVPRLLSVAMMRPGDKLASYRLLAQALGEVRDMPWRLDVVGDGPAADDVRASLAPLGERVRLRGRADDRGELARIYARSDLLVWPAVNEAYGMALLEAQAQGCPVLAGAYGGVAGMVRDGETGRLAPPGDALAFAEALRELLREPSRLTAMGASARRFARGERGLDGAALRLRAALAPLVAEGVRR